MIFLRPLLVIYFSLYFPIVSTTSPQKSQECSLGAMDVVFVVDKSSVIGRDNFETVLKEVDRFTKSLDISVGYIDRSQAALVVFNEDAEVAFGLTEHASNKDVSNALKSIPYSGGGMNISAGMQTALRKVYTRDILEDRGDPNLPHIMIIITAGTDSSNVLEQQRHARLKNIAIYVVGIFNDTSGNDIKQLETAAGSPRRVFHAETFQELPALMDLLCNTIASPEANVQHPRACPCTPESLWLDIVVVMDSSRVVSKEEFEKVREILMKSITRIRSFGQENGQHSRIAFVKVGEQAERISNLTTYTNTAEVFTELIRLKMTDDLTPDMAQGLSEAERIFSEADKIERRDNVQKIIVFLSGAEISCRNRERNAAEADICRLSSRLRSSGVTILTVALGDVEPYRIPANDIGTSCFALTSETFTTEIFLRLLCTANCYCSGEFVQFADRDECLFYGECVHLSGFALGYQGAVMSCGFENETLADVFSKEKDVFLSEMAAGYGDHSYWLGLFKDINETSYVWSSGEKLEADDYSNWGKTPNTATGNQSCVIAKLNNDGVAEWFNEECSRMIPSHFFFCQRHTCDTINYCP